MKHCKCHARLVFSVAKLMRCSYFALFNCVVSVEYFKTNSTTDQDKELAEKLLNEFMETNVVPLWFENYLLDIMTGRRVLTNQAGHLLNLTQIWKAVLCTPT